MQSKERRKKDLAQRQGDLFQCAAANAETGMRKSVPKAPITTTVGTNTRSRLRRRLMARLSTFERKQQRDAVEQKFRDRLDRCILPHMYLITQSRPRS